MLKLYIIYILKL